MYLQVYEEMANKDLERIIKQRELKPKRPRWRRTGVACFEIQKTPEYRKKFPNLKSKQLTKLMRKDYYDLNDLDKQAYVQMAIDQQPEFLKSRSLKEAQRKRKRNISLHHEKQMRKKWINNKTSVKDKFLMKITREALEKWSLMDEAEKKVYKRFKFCIFLHINLLFALNRSLMTTTRTREMN